MRHARSIIRRVCDIAGQATCIDDLRYGAIETGLVDAVENRDTAGIFDWLMRELSHQGISDAVADGYMDRHGNVTWAEIERSLGSKPGCDKLQGYWAFTGWWSIFWRPDNRSHACYGKGIGLFRTDPRYTCGRRYRRTLTGADVRFGSKADKPSRAKIHLCPLWSNSGQTLVRLLCPLSAQKQTLHLPSPSVRN